MTFQRVRARVRHRRSVVTIAALFVVAVTPLLALSASPAPASASPASLASPAVASLIVNAPDDVKPVIDDAAGRATIALTRPECEALLADPFGQFSPSVVLASSTLTYQATPPADAPDAGATVRSDAAGPGQEIRIHRPFIDYLVEINGVSTGPIFEGRPEPLQFDPNIVRAVAILHEVGHLTRAEPAHQLRLDEQGRLVPSSIREGLYNTRILNTCFAERHLITGLSCVQNIVSIHPIFDVRSNLDCFGGCRVDVGPLVLSWTSSLLPSAPVDVDTVMDGEVCFSFRTSECPFPNGISGQVVVTFDVTDAAGKTSSDAALVDCINPRIPIW